VLLYGFVITIRRERPLNLRVCASTVAGSAIGVVRICASLIMRTYLRSKIVLDHVCEIMSPYASRQEIIMCGTCLLLPKINADLCTCFHYVCQFKQYKVLLDYVFESICFTERNHRVRYMFASLENQ
jgi:hypothetical protein